MDKRLDFDVTVVGAGVTGLLIARGLARLGYSAALIEEDRFVGAGATTRNEGWLHHGTYHANSIRHRPSAVLVAKRCLYGAARFKSIAPEAVEEPFTRSFAFSSRGVAVAEFEDRWQEAGVPFCKLSTAQLRREVPSLIGTDVVAAYEVADTAVNTRTLCMTLVGQCRRLGVRIVTHASVERIESATIELATDKGLDRFGTRLVVVASGYASARFATKLGLDMPPLRFWRSHLLLLPRFERHRVFSLDPGDVAVMNHQSAAIVGLNEDAQHIPEPATETDVSAVNDIRHAFRARFGTSASVDARPVACVKVDVAPSAGAPRSLAPTMFALSDNIIAALPGKMSEAPYVADRMVPVLARQLGSSQVAARPCDHLLNSEREWWSQE